MRKQGPGLHCSINLNRWKSGKGECNMKTQTAILTKDEKAILNTYRKLDNEKKEAAAYHCNYLLKHEPRKEFDFQTLANLNLDGFLHEIGYID